jgi:hypothetical protein
MSRPWIEQKQQKIFEKGNWNQGDSKKNRIDRNFMFADDA